MLNLAWAKTFLALVETKSFHTRTTPSSSSSLRVSVATRGRLGQLQLSGGGLASLALGLRTDAGRFCLHALRRSLIRISERALSAVRTGQTRVGASSNIGIYILQPYVRRFLRDHNSELFDLVIDRKAIVGKSRKSRDAARRASLSLRAI